MHETGQPKTVYLARRRPGMTREAFILRWRRHGALAMAQPRWVNVARYAHCDAVGEAADGTGSGNCDGVGLISYRSLSHRLAHVADRTSQATMEADELETFFEPVARSRMLCREHVSFEAGPGSVKLFRFVTRPAHLTHADFATAWLDRRARQAPVLRDLVSGHIVNTAYETPDVSRPGLACDLVEEFRFDRIDRVDAARSLIERASDGRDAGTILTLLTRETVLHGTGPGGTPA